MREHPFTAGEVYNNRIGPYKVVRPNEQEGTMLIRYLDSGEEWETSILLKARIWRNISSEEQDKRLRRRHPTNRVMVPISPVSLWMSSRTIRDNANPSALSLHERLHRMEAIQVDQRLELSLIAHRYHFLRRSPGA